MRRLGADGSLGPWIPVTDASAGTGAQAVAVGGDGTVAIGVVDQSRAADPARWETVLLTSSLAPGATAVTPVQELNRESGSRLLLDEDLAIAIGPRHETVLAVNSEQPAQRLLLFGGSAGRLRAVGAFPVRYAVFAVAATADGGATAVWSGDDGAQGATPVYAARREPGRAFGAPSVIAKTIFDPSESSIAPVRLISMSGGNTAALLDDSAPSGDVRTTLKILTR